MKLNALPSALAQVSLLAAAVCFLAGAGATVLDVLLRAVWNESLPGVIEMTSLSIALGALLSIPVCYLRGTHVTARLLSETNPQLFQRPLSVLGSILSVVFAGVLAGMVTLNAFEKWGGPETTRDLQLPMSVLLAVTAFGFVVALLAAVANVAGELSRGRLND